MVQVERDLIFLMELIIDVKNRNID